MKKLTLYTMVASLCILGLATACSQLAQAPTSKQVEAIKNACAVDAGIRPVVTELLAVPNLSTPEEVAIVAAARAVIDPICANPTNNLEQDAITAVTGAASQIADILGKLQARRAVSK